MAKETKRKRKPRKQNEVTAESFDVMADDLLKQIEKGALNVPSIYGKDRAAEMAYAASRDSLRVQAGVFRREAERVRNKR